MVEYDKLYKDWNQRTIEIIKELYAMCLEKWEMEWNLAHYYVQDKAIDLIEELMYNALTQDYALHWWSNERPRAIQLECNPTNTSVKAWLYYPFGKTLFVEALIEGEEAKIYPSIF